MNVESARRVMETTCPDTANQYLRFGWKLINQYAVEATAETPAAVKYVLASFRSLDDTHEVLTLSDTAAVNEYLKLGWKLIDKYVTAADDRERRDETPHFVMAWQGDGAPPRPGTTPSVGHRLEVTSEPDEELI